MAQELVGYAHLIEQFQLPARQPATVAAIDSATKGRQTTAQGDIELMQFERRYRPKPTLAAHLQFALRYEGLNLEVLALLFAKTGRSELESNLAEKPESSFARRIGFLYEWQLVTRSPQSLLQEPLMCAWSTRHFNSACRTVPKRRSSE